jgi:hypothetical protein
MCSWLQLNTRNSVTDCCAAALLTLLCYRICLLSVLVCTINDPYRKNTGLGPFYSSWICGIAVALNWVFFSPTFELQMVDPECDYLLSMLLFT